MKKWLSILLTLGLLLSLGAPALAAPGDVTVWYSLPDNGYMNSFLQYSLLAGQKVYCFLEGSGTKLVVYDLETKASEEYDLSELFTPEELPADGEDDAETEDAEAEDAEAGEADDEDYGWEKVEFIEGEGYDYEEIALWFAWRDQVYAVVSRHITDDNNEQTMEGGMIRRLTLENGTASLTEDPSLPRLDWTDLTEGGGNYVYSRYIRSSFCLEDTLYALTYDESSNDLLVLFDLAAGTCESRILRDIGSLVPGPEGQLIITQYDWNSGDGELILSLYDPASESTQRVSAVPLNEQLPNNLCYDAEKDTLYFVRSGEVWAAPGMDLTQAVSVNDCPVTGDNGVTCLTEDGYLLLYDSQSAVLRSTDPSQRQEITLNVTDYAYLNALDSAYYDFIASHGDVSVVINRDSAATDVLQAMMNQDGTADIYCLDMATSQFSALFERGYMADLSGSAKLTSLVDRMYPAVSESVKQNGRLVALPMYAYGYTLGINPTVFEKLGYTEADIPTTWESFFNLLNELPEKLDGSGIQAFMQWYTAGDLKMMLFTQILSGYQDYLNTGADGSYAFNTPTMQHVLEMMESVDYAALGIPEELNQDEDSTFSWSDDSELLFETGVQLTMGTYDSPYRPLLLSFGDEAPTGTYHMTVAFINPYSRHPEEALAFLETLSDRTETVAAYTFSPENNEPVRYPDFDEYYGSLQESLDQAKEALEKAGDAEEQASWQETVSMIEAEMKNVDTTYWLISPSAIASYQARALSLSPMTYDLSSLISDAGDNSFYESMQRYYTGQMSSRELLEFIDQKYQMMRLEGN